MYDNISFDALGAILGLDADAAELTARRMIEQGRSVHSSLCFQSFHSSLFRPLSSFAAPHPPLLSLSPPPSPHRPATRADVPSLRAWIDQPLRLLHFESRSTRDTADAQGTAGGLGVQREEKEVAPVSWTERWDERIWAVSTEVSGCGVHIPDRGSLRSRGKRTERQRAGGLGAGQGLTKRRGPNSAGVE